MQNSYFLASFPMKPIYKIASGLALIAITGVAVFTNPRFFPG